MLEPVEGKFGVEQTKEFSKEMAKAKAERFMVGEFAKLG